MIVEGRDRLADVFGVSSRTVQNWESKGMPFKDGGGKGKANRYDTAQCIAWKCEGTPSGLAAEKERLTREQADAKEIENAVSRGELVPRSVAMDTALEAIGIFKTQLELAPARWASALVAMDSDYDAISAYLTDETRIVLTELSEGFVLPDKAGADSAASDDGEPVGGPVPETKQRGKRRAR